MTSIPRANGEVSSAPSTSAWASKYRGATVEDLDPPPALSCSPTDPISHALMNAYERDYTHLTVVSRDTRALLGYLNIPRLRQLLKEGRVSESEPVEKAMQKFQRRRGNVYKVITMDTPLEELEAFFTGGVAVAVSAVNGRVGVDGSSENGSGSGSGSGSGPQDFAVITDGARRFVLGVATRGDLEEFVKRRPAY